LLFVIYTKKHGISINEFKFTAGQNVTAVHSSSTSNRSSMESWGWIILLISIVLFGVGLNLYMSAQKMKKDELAADEM